MYERSDADAREMLNIGAKRYRDGKIYDSKELLCVEEPLEIAVNDEPCYLTMRLPGQDAMLALGLCFTEGIISNFKDVLSISCCENSPNRVNVYLAGMRQDVKLPKKRGRIVQTACGICGKQLISDICTDLKKRQRTLSLELSRILEMQKTIESQQIVFSTTGCTHMAGLFDGSGNLLAFAEDVGRHNALDKVIGQVLFTGKDREAKIVILSSRLSYEMIQKSARLNVEIVAGSSAPTSLAADLARQLGITLIGFLRQQKGATVYTFPERITTYS